LKARMRFPISD